ncbi:MAG: 1-acyl-sn-glycerol-3-phosphate acyltransferase [Firmicutes bacterium]|nr:1-acyl-sn-glycerol-3-phosphate acyltransferase [Bacillota bacterium]
MLYILVVAALRLLVPLIFRVRIEGNLHIPREGAVVLAANHRSLWDPVFVTLASRRPVHFMAKEELFRVPVLGFLLPYLNAFPVRRGQSDRKAIRQALSVLNDGSVLGIFVEGTRNKDQTSNVLPLKHGAAMLASRSEASIVPVAIQRIKRRITIKVGQPLIPHWQFEERRARYEMISQNLQDVLSQMLEPVPQS